MFAQPESILVHLLWRHYHVDQGMSAFDMMFSKAWDGVYLLHICPCYGLNLDDLGWRLSYIHRSSWWLRCAIKSEPWLSAPL